MEKSTLSVFKNHTLRLLRENQLALGFGVHHLRTAGTGMIGRATDHDWLFIDTEHGAFSQDDLAQLCLAALPVGITPIVRVCKSALDEGTRALDNGAQGIVIPHVDTPDEAQRAVSAFRYPPNGHRSWGGAPAIFGYQAPGNAEAQALADPEIMIVCMIESPEGLANVDAIAATPGVDVVMIGTSDLSAELGISGQIGHPKVQEAFDKVAAACHAAGKVMGMGGVYDSEWAKRYIATGVRFVLSGTDHTFLMDGAKARSSTLRKTLQPPEG